ncbi:MAG TPA: IclR family transcriptional regulator [Acidobacteriaceae bacterium]|nr:IclR family transcriptional regulator [Acidobacteriaceae bacterium]
MSTHLIPLQDESVDGDNSAAESGDRKPRIQSAVRTISILLAVADSPNGMKAMEIMQHVGLSRQVTYHLIHTMLGTGIIRKTETNRYVLGLANVSIVEGFHRQLAPPEQLAHKVRSIVAATGETAHAGGWVDGEIVALATAAGQAPVAAVQVPQGYSGYAHARAAGKLLLAMIDPGSRQAYLAKHPLASRTSKTITDPEKLEKELEQIRARGYSIDNEEFYEGLQCLAVPVQGLRGRFVLGISVPKERFEKKFDQYLAALLNSARIDR